MLQVADYSVLLDHEYQPQETDSYVTFKGTHEGANGSDHDVTLRIPTVNKDDQQFIKDLIADAIDRDDADAMLIGVTGPACPEVTAALITVPEKEVKGETLPEAEEKCSQIKNLIVDVQSLRQKDPREPISSTAIVIGEGLINTYLTKDQRSNGDMPKGYKVCEELNLCTPAASELNETVDPLKVKPAEGLPVARFFEAATTEDAPASFPSGYVTVTGFLEFGEGGFYGQSGKPVAYSRLRLVATDVIPLGIAPNGRSEGKRQQQMMQQRKRVMRFGDSSEDNASTKKRSLSSLKK